MAGKGQFPMFIGCILFNMGTFVPIPGRSLDQHGLGSTTKLGETKNKFLGEGLFLTVNYILSMTKIDLKGP